MIDNNHESQAPYYPPASGAAEALAKFGTVGTEETIAQATEIVLTAASSTIANNWAQYALVAAMYASKTGKPILADTHLANAPGGLEQLLQHSPYHVTADQDDQNKLTLNQQLVGENLSGVFGSRRGLVLFDRIGSLAERAKAKWGGAVATRKVAYFEATQPPSVMSVNGTPYIQRIIADRLQAIQLLASILDDHMATVNIQEAHQLIGDTSMADVLAFVAESHITISQRMAFSFQCAECSLSRFGTALEAKERVRHYVDFRGQAFPKMGQLVNHKPKIDNHCQTLSALSRVGNFRELPIRSLLGAGFRPSGELQYLLDTFAYKQPGAITAIEDYSGARGTIASALKAWTASGRQFIITPHVSVMCVGPEGASHDATSYELTNALLDANPYAQENAQTLKDFAAQVPLITDGQSYTLIIGADGKLQCAIRAA